jgi:hypothetical protein
MLQAALDHPGIVPVYETGEDGESLYIAMKLVRGTDLKRLSEGGELEPERALAILAQAAAALDAAHESGLIHRDVKPQNILIDEDDRAYLADFGVTKTSGDRGVTLTGHYVGSLDYTPPERVRGERLGSPADVYAFAAVLYEALTGEVPFPYDDEAAILFAHVSEAPPRPTEHRPDLPSGLDEVVARGLAKRPEDRYRSATELVDAARRALASPPAPAPRNGNGRRRFGETVVDPAVMRTGPVFAPPRERRFTWRAVLLAALVILALAVLGYALGLLTRDDGTVTRDTAVAGPLTLSFPRDDWRPATPRAVPGMRLVGATALASTDEERPATLVAGLAPDAQGAGLLPPQLKQRLPAAPTPHPVRLENLRAIVYRNLPVGSGVDLFLVPLRGGAAAVACLRPQILRAGQQAGNCDEVAATLRLRGLRPLPLGGPGPYAAQAASILTRLDGERLAGRRQLAGATRRIEQARTAHVLAAAYAGAAAALRATTPSPFARPSHNALYGALREAQRAYTALEDAAVTGNQAGYARAARRLEAVEKKVDRSIARLERVRLG